MTNLVLMLNEHNISELRLSRDSAGWHARVFRPLENGGLYVGVGRSRYGGPMDAIRDACRDLPTGA